MGQFFGIDFVGAMLSQGHEPLLNTYLIYSTSSTWGDKGEGDISHLNLSQKIPPRNLKWESKKSLILCGTKLMDKRWAKKRVI